MTPHSAAHVLFFSYDHRFGQEEDSPEDPNRGRPDTGLAQLWDPDTRQPVGPAQVLDTNPFCAGQCVMPDGRVLVAGGHAAYDPTAAWTLWQAFWAAQSGHGADHRAYMVDPVTGQ